MLLDAFAQLDREADLWVVGDGPQTAHLRARDIPHVSWLGRVSDDEKARRLQAATIGCFPAIEGESFGVVLLEAMASGAAVVASDIDGYRTVARHDEEGVLVPPGDPAALAAALRAVLDDDTRRAALAKAGHARAAEFSMSWLAERFVETYERALARPAATPDPVT